MNLSPFTREKILTRFLVLLGQKDFNAISTRELAKSCEISEATLFRYFPRKELLLHATMSHLGGHLFIEIREILGYIADPEERLRAICQRHLDFGLKNKSLIFVMKREFTFNKDCEALPACYRELKKFLKTLEKIIQEGQEKGIFKCPGDPKIFAHLFFNIVDMVLFREKLAAPKKIELAALRRKGAHIFSILLTALKGV